MKSLITLAVVASLSLVACKRHPTETVADVVVSNAPSASSTTQQAVDEMRANFQRVQFALDSATLDAQSKQALNANAALMRRFADIRVEVQGHADERGTTDYNIALGQRRAAAVQRYLTEAGVAQSRITVVSYGEEKPLSRDHSEIAWSQNRRAEFRITHISNGEPVSGTTN